MRRLIILLLLALLSLGCRTDPNAKREIALLRAEILDLEDQYFISQAELQECQGKPGSKGSTYYAPIRGQAQIIEGEYLEVDGYSGSFGGDCDSCPPLSQPVLRGRDPNDGPALTPPGNASGPDRVQPQPLDTPPAENDRGQRVIPEFSPNARELEEITPNDSSYNPIDGRTDRIEIEFDDIDDGRSGSNEGHMGQRSPVETDSRRDDISRITINPSVTGGQDLDGAPGHEGLVLLIQPETPYGEFVQAAGELTVTITDRGDRQSRQRVGQWQLTANETKNFFVKPELPERGILLHLPWDQFTPKSRQLAVHVRYTTRDQRNLDASTEIDIEPPAEDYRADDVLVRRWIENDQRWADISDGTSAGISHRGGSGSRFSNNNPTFRAAPIKGNRSATPPRWRPVR